MADRITKADDAYEAQKDRSPVSGHVPDDSYSRGVQQGEPVPVQSDRAPVEDPVQPSGANTDDNLGAEDERAAMDKSNILKGPRTRQAKPQTATGYSEGPEEDDLPSEVVEGTTGKSSTR